MLEFFIYAFFIVAVAVVYCEVLLAPGMILDFWDKFLHKHIKSDWLLKPLGDCVYCFGGQLALWGFILLFWGHYSVILHIGFVFTVLFVIHIYKMIWN
jgi:hypothetical protein